MNEADLLAAFRLILRQRLVTPSPAFVIPIREETL